jgi:hypothetical protein
MAPRSTGPLPPPPPALQKQDLPLLSFGATLFRIFRTDRDPAFWGKTRDNRFDSPAAEFGVLYAATDQYGAFIETCGGLLNRTVTTSFLGARGWARVIPARDLKLVDLSGPGLARIGADERLSSGEHDVAQQWSLALWQHPATVDGIHYRARHDPSRTSVALFDRAAPALTITEDGGLLADVNTTLLAAILDTYEFSLL